MQFSVSECKSAYYVTASILIIITNVICTSIHPSFYEIISENYKHLAWQLSESLFAVCIVNFPVNHYVSPLYTHPVVQLCKDKSLYKRKRSLLTRKVKPMWVEEMEHAVPELGVAGELAWLACADTLAASTAVLTAQRFASS